uniref:Putative homing endonuclease n=1 Tax=viral metagenome TaxID=1070528 RepID=A0A6M3IX37_9ZZZZ
MKRSPINKVSAKQAKLNAIWKKLFWQAIDEQHALKGYTYCEMCGHSKLSADLDPHHIKRRRRYNYVYENLRLECRKCHDKDTFGGGK